MRMVRLGGVGLLVCLTVGAVSCDRTPDRLELARYVRIAEPGDFGAVVDTDWAGRAAEIRRIPDHAAQMRAQIPGLARGSRGYASYLVAELARVEARPEYGALFRQLLNDEEPLVAGKAVNALAELPASFSAPILFEFLQEPPAGWSVQRYLALRALAHSAVRGASEDEAAEIREYLIAVAEREEDGHAATVAVNALQIGGMIGADECAGLLDAIVSRFPNMAQDGHLLRVRHACESKAADSGGGD